MADDAMMYASMNLRRRGHSRFYTPDAGRENALPTNIILDIVRDWDGGDPWFESCELLYALHRLWGLYQDPSMGTSPIDARDAGDECALFDQLDEALDDLDVAEASRMIVHATRVAMLWNGAVIAAGRDY